MGKKTNRLYEIINKYQDWIDKPRYFPKEFEEKNNNEILKEQIMEMLKEEMIRQKIPTMDGKLHIPLSYLVELPEEMKDWTEGKKKQLLLNDFNLFIERYIRLFSIDTLEREFVQLQISEDINNPDEIKISSDWGREFVPEIRFNQNWQSGMTFDLTDVSKNTITSTFGEKDDSENLESDCETVIRPNLEKLYSLEIWHNGLHQNCIPIFQVATTIGRSVDQQISLSGDFEISRRQAILTYQNDNTFNLINFGQNPIVFKDEIFLFKNQTMSFNSEERFQIGSYSMEVKR